MLVPAQYDVDRYFDRWKRLVEAEPVLNGRYPQRYRDRDFSPSIHTTNSEVIDAWTTAAPDPSTGLVHVSLRTGDADFDAIIEQLRPNGLNAFWTNDSGTYNFKIWVDSVYNEELLAADLAGHNAWLNAPEHVAKDDGIFQWLGNLEAPTGEDDATAYIEFTFGWGDCFSGCMGFHSLRAYVPAATAPTVYDLGGDPLPPGMMLSPDTIPLQ